MSFRKIDSSLKKLLKVDNRCKLIYESCFAPGRYLNFECDIELDEYGWCSSCCRNRRFELQFDNWTSGNKKIDEFIRSTQLFSKNLWHMIEWIAFEEFADMEKIGEG